jgi:multicomponent Na+:H+ antiporter subunit E
MRIAGRIAALVALWLLAWGEVTVGNVIGGLAVASALLVVFPLGPRARLRLRPVAVARLAAHVAVQLVISNVVMARQVLRPRPALRPGVLAHRLTRGSDEVVTAMTSIIALSPGTMTVDVDTDDATGARTIQVHFLLLDDPDTARASLRHLEHLVAGALAEP